MEANVTEKEANDYVVEREDGVDSHDLTLANNNSSCKTQQESADDPMLGFLTLLAKVERPSCANCESKDVSPMFYCNTCGQAICSVCKKNTHSAKMFSRHDISSVSPYTREPQRKCPVHHEICIMFSPANESLLCINCFRDLPPDIRAQCLDLDSAYNQKCERLQKGLKAVGELEVTIKDEALAYKDLLKELHMNAMREESTIHVFSKILQGVVTQTEEKLIEKLKREIQSKEIMLEEKLGTLESLQSNVQAYLTLSSAFINSASKYELLKLANGLVERLSDIGAVVQPTKISLENSWVSSNFKAEFSQSLKEMFHKEMWMQELLDINVTATATAAAKAEGTRKVEEKEKMVVVKRKETCPKEDVAYKKIALPFLGRSQSLLNIPLNLDPNEVSVCSLVVATSSSSPPRQLPKKKAEFFHCQSTQTLPKDGKKGSQRSKSVDANSRLKSLNPIDQISQVELLVSIQSHEKRRGEKKDRERDQDRDKEKLFLTSMIGVRKFDEKKKNEMEKTAKPQPAGNLCVVQAMVHQDGTHSSSNSSKRKKIESPAQRAQWEPFYEPLNAMNVMRKREPATSSDKREMVQQQLVSQLVSTSSTRPSDSSGSSIELTADQVRELIHAISAAQNNNREEKTSWVAPFQMKEAAEKKMAHPRPNLQRNDSFEGHEQAVRMLVDAVHEIQQICTTKGSCEHF